MADEEIELDEVTLKQKIRQQNKLDKVFAKEKKSARAAYKKARAANKARARARARAAHEDTIQQTQGDNEMMEELDLDFSDFTEEQVDYFLDSLTEEELEFVNSYIAEKKVSDPKTRVKADHGVTAAKGRAITAFGASSVPGGALGVKYIRARKHGTSMKGVRAKDRQRTADKVAAKAKAKPTSGRLARKAVRKQKRADRLARSRAKEKIRAQKTAKKHGIKKDTTGKDTTNLQRRAYGEQFESVMNLVQAANEGSPSRVLDLLTPIMSNKVTDHLATKKIQIAGDFIGIPPEEGLLDDE